MSPIWTYIDNMFYIVYKNDCGKNCTNTRDSFDLVEDQDI